MELISIVIPVFNAEKTIRKCIRSILNQSYHYFEVILVNDGSTDNTSLICQQEMRNDSRIVLYSIKNSGANKAREFGVIRAKGSYILFVDADDTLKSEALLHISQYLNKYDIIVGNVAFTKDLSSIEYIRLLLTHKIPTAPWAKFIKKHLFNPFVFDIPRQLIKGEDEIMNIRLVQPGIIIKALNIEIYCYTPASDSITKKFKYNLNHEEIFFTALERSLDNNEMEQIESIILNMKLLAYTNLIFHKVPFQYIPKFIQTLRVLIESHQLSVSLWNRLFLMSDNKMLKYLMATINKLKDKL